MEHGVSRIVERSTVCSAIELVNQVGLVLCPGRIESFWSKQPGDTMVLEGFLVYQLWDCVISLLVFSEKIQSLGATAQVSMTSLLAWRDNWS